MSFSHSPRPSVNIFSIKKRAVKAADVFLLNTENKSALRFTISFNVGSSWQAIIIVKPVDWCGAQPTGIASKRWLTNRPTVKPSEAIITIQTFFITQMKTNKKLRIFCRL